MEDEAVTQLAPPTIDLIHYWDKFVDFFISHAPGFLGSSKSILGFLIGISIPISLFLFIGIIYVIEGLKSTRKREEEKYGPPPEAKVKEAKGDPVLAKKWEKIIAHSESQNENDWRQAIIEADIMLEDLLVKLGYQGEGIGLFLLRKN
jgi:hypothetical protein